MQAQDDRARELERLYQSRRGRKPSNSSSSAQTPPSPPDHLQLARSSTSPPSLMYSNFRNDASTSSHSPLGSRPLSFIPSPRGEVIDTSPTVARQLSGGKNVGPRFHNPFGDERRHLSPNDRTVTAPAMAGSGHDKDPRNARSNNDPSLNHLMSMQQAHHDSDMDGHGFDLGEIDLDTSPDAVAREFSNLQAIRRMSMDVNTQDPDLPAFGVPAMAPSHNDDEDDPSRMYWVPARLHPELAPKEFKTFIQERVRTLKRSSLSDEPLAPGASSGSLRRRKSMLSRQIENGHGYEDGATRLERKKSLSGQAQPEVNLQELEQMMSDPSSIARRISLDQSSLDTGEVPMQQDMPMLPAKPPGSTLKRSTRTQYRKGSLKHKPLLRRQTLKEDEDRSNSPSPSPEVPRLPDVPSLPDFSEFTNAAFGLTRVQTDPTPASGSKPIDNFSRPGRGRAQTPPSQPTTWSYDEAPAVQKPDQSQQRHSQDEHPVSQPPAARYANGRSSPSKPAPIPIPQIIEPQAEPPQRSPPPAETRHMTPPIITNRTSSVEQPSAPPSGPLPGRPIAQRQKLQRPQSLPQRPAQQTNQRPGNVTLDDIAASSLHGNGSVTESQSLTAIPMYDDGKRSEKKKSRDDGSKKWSWFSSGDKEDKSQKNKAKLQKPSEKTHDSARLDVIQTSISGNQQKGRESTVFDRESIHIDDEGKKKKGLNEPKKEKDGLFSSLFSSSKAKKGDKDSHAAKAKHSAASLRGLSPDPPQRVLRPDLDFPWTRFSIMEERAIYRMAHIKLANPRRELYSQVLLSNFMYSYLAKVQQMHPHVQIPQSAAQKQAQRQERQQQQKQAEQERKQERQERLEQRERQARENQPQREPGLEEFAQYQRYHEEQARLEQQSPGPNSYQPEMADEQGRTNPYLDSQMNQSRTQYSQQAQGYGNEQQQYQMNGSMYANHGSEEDWHQQQHQQHQQHQQQQQQWFQVSDHSGAGGRERGYW